MNPLFRNSTTALQARAAAEFRATPLGRSLSAIDRLSKRGRVATPEGRRVLAQLKHVKAKDIVGNLEKTSIGRQVARYAMGGLRSDESTAAIATLLKALGPIGQVLFSFLDPKSSRQGVTQRDLDAAAKLLEAFNYDVRKRTTAHGPPTSSGDIGDMAATLEAVGWDVHPPEPQVAPREYTQTARGTPRKRVDVRVGGEARRFKTTDPIMTGHMIQVEGSSNVHSIGFQWNYEEPAHGTLKVRFFQTARGTKSKEPGPTYFYYDVNPAVFEAFRRASSKGEFVWDRIRVRGSQTAHRYFYELKGIANGYVPRKATRLGPTEHYIPRSIRARSRRTGEIRTLKSPLPHKRLGAAPVGSATVGIRPSRGTPDRGTPNRGR